MMRTEQDLAAYKRRITDGVIGTIIRESIITQPDGSRVSAVLSGEVTDILLMQIAMLVSGSAECGSPAKIRKFCDALARKLQRHITDANRIGTGMQHVQLGEAQ